jgi:hypothetical protein
MNNILSRVGMLSIAFLILYIIKKLFDSNAVDEEIKIYKFEDDD